MNGWVEYSSNMTRFVLHLSVVSNSLFSQGKRVFHLKKTGGLIKKVCSMQHIPLIYLQNSTTKGLLLIYPILLLLLIFITIYIMYIHSILHIIRSDMSAVLCNSVYRIG